MGLIGDDVVMYSPVRLDRTYLDFIVSRYRTWSGRLLVEFVVVVLNKIGIPFWKVADSIMYTVIAYCMDLLLNKKKESRITWMICLSVLLFPLVTMGSAGWIATSVGYSWTLAAALTALLPLRDIQNGGTISKWMPLYLICYVFATDAEQITTMALVGFPLFMMVLKKKGYRIPLYLKLLTIITVAKFIFILTTPGNKVRMADEVGRWFPEYSAFSFFQKIYIGILYTTRVLLDYPLIIMLVFLALALLTFQNKLDIRTKVLSLVSMSLLILLTTGCGWLTPDADIFVIIRTYISTNYTGKKLTIDSAIIIIIIAYLIISLIYLIVRTLWEIKLEALAIVVLGCMSQMMMVFSPTVYASTYRTGIYMYFAFIVLIIICGKRITEYNNEKTIIPFWTVLIVASIANVLSNYAVQ